MKIGIMQGRLSPPVDGKLQAFPRDTWQDEFALAKKVGFDYIEWVFDSMDNPLLSWWGQYDMLAVSNASGVKIKALCADFFVKNSVFEWEDLFAWVMRACAFLGIETIVLPFVDEAAISADSIERAADVVARLESNSPASMRICLETNLSPYRTRRLLKLIARASYPLDASRIGIAYDTGNSASLGYDMAEELEAYSGDILHVHIKDRLIHGVSVPYGEGDADWKTIPALVSEYVYAGDFTLQPARGEVGKEVEWAKHNLEFFKRVMNVTG